MADFAAVLRKTIDGLPDATPELRQRVYAKARSTIEQKLAALNPSEDVKQRQRKTLEDAIAEVEADYAVAVEDFSFDLEPADTDPGLPPFVQPEPKQKPEQQGDPLEDFLASSERAVKADHAEPRPAADSDGETRGAFENTTPDRGFGQYTGEYEERSGLAGWAVKGALALAVLGAIGFAGWTYRDQITPYVGGTTGGDANTTDMEESEAVDDENVLPGVGAENAAPEEPEEPKLTQRLQADGTEVDPGPAGGEASIGEGTSVAEATPGASGIETAPGQTPPPADTNAPAALPVGQKAFFYEERSGQEAGTAKSGSVVWSVVQESPGNDLPPEPAIRAEVTIPETNINLRMVIRRNGDQSLPASHLVEMIFTVPEGFAGGAIDNVQRMTFKDSEQAAGSPLIGVPAKIADNFFIIALDAAQSAVNTNTTLIQRQPWIDIPITYRTGRRALLTLEKGVAGDRVFDEVLKAWAAKPGG